MTYSIYLIIIFCCFSGFSGCELVEPKKDPEMLDWVSDPYPSSIPNNYFLISDSLQDPTETQKDFPVIIAAHGFTATTFEWQEFRTFADTQSGAPFLVSQVLLGNHGLSYEEFKKSTWENWQKPIMKEYRALVDLGYNNISLAGSSTGGALIMELLGSDAFEDLPKPRHIFMVDAIVIPSSKLLTMIDLVGPIVGNSVSEPENTIETEHWYSNRPAEALSELMEIITQVREQLEDGIKLPGETKMKVYKSMEDDSAHPVSALLIFNGVEDADGNHIQVKMVDSDKHVFTRGLGRGSSWTDKDTKIQYDTFREIRDMVTPTTP